MSVEAVVRAHMDAGERGDPSAMAADYADDAVLTRPGMCLVGLAAIQSYFEGIPARLGGGTVRFLSFDIHDHHISFRWIIEGGPGDRTSGIDEVTVQDGKIVAQMVRLDGGDF